MGCNIGPALSGTPLEAFRLRAASGHSSLRIVSHSNATFSLLTAVKTTPNLVDRLGSNFPTREKSIGF